MASQSRRSEQIAITTTGLEYLRNSVPSLYDGPTSRKVESPGRRVRAKSIVDKPPGETLLRLDSFGFESGPDFCSSTEPAVFPKLSEFSVETNDSNLLNPTYWNIAQNINQKVQSELAQWETRHRKKKLKKQELERKQQRNQSLLQRNNEEFDNLSTRKNLLSKRIEHMEKDNVELKEFIQRLEEATAKQGSESSAAEASLSFIKDKLYQGTLNISQEKKQHINLLKRLSTTRFNPSNEKHAALLQKFFELHELTVNRDPSSQLALLGIGDNTSILALQNLVYCSDRHGAMASRLNDIIDFPVVGVQITSVLSSLLSLSESGVILPVNDISRAFVHLLDHSKAFEELYCLCMSIYERAVQKELEDPLQVTERKITDLLRGNVVDIPDLIEKASDSWVL